MLYSQETEYAIRIIDALKDEKLHTAEEICAEHEVPSVWIYKIAKKLSNMGFINIKRGCRGGYTLKKDLNVYTLKDLIYAMEPGLCIKPCIKGPCPMDRDKVTCPIHAEKMRLQRGVIRLLEERTMREVVFGETAVEEGRVENAKKS